MTLTELYQNIDGDMSRALQIMRMEKLINKNILKLRNSGLDNMLAEARETMDATKLFESTHAMKGVCANLGLVQLSEQASELTEEFRPGAARSMSDAQAQEKLAALQAKLENTLSCIAQYEAELG